MRQQTDFIFSKNTFKRTLQLCSFTLLSLYYLNGEHVLGDSTFFPEDMDTELGIDKTDKKGTDSVAEWAELTPPKKETAQFVPSKNEEKIETSLSQPRATPEKLETQKQDPLQLRAIKPHPKALPVQEKDQVSSSQKEQKSPKTVVSYTEAANNRSPLGLLDPAKEVHSQRWYLYSSAIRALKNSPEAIHIVSMEAKEPKRGEEVKNLLVEMGIEPEKIKLIHGQGEGNQAGVVYIFAGK